MSCPLPNPGPGPEQYPVVLLSGYLQRLATRPRVSSENKALCPEQGLLLIGFTLVSSFVLDVGAQWIRGRQRGGPGTGATPQPGCQQD